MRMSGRLAGAVLAEEGVDLAAADVEVDRVVGDEVPEALGDPAQLDQGRRALPVTRGPTATPAGIDRARRLRLVDVDPEDAGLDLRPPWPPPASVELVRDATPATSALIGASAAPPLATMEKSLRSCAVYEPAMTWSMTYLTVGAMFQVTLVTTFSGASACWSPCCRRRASSFSWAASMTPKRSAYSTSAPAPIWASAASLAAAGSNQLLRKVTLTSTSGFISWAPAMKALVMRFTSGTG